MTFVREAILDHGYLQYIEHWGSDERIIEAARMSTAKGFLGWGPRCRTCGDPFEAPYRLCPQPTSGRELVDTGRGGHMFDEPGDEKLLRYLYEKNHSTPFEMAGLVIEVQAPIMVFREWQRHRTQAYNELSARYTPLPDLNYVPTVERLMLNAGGSNKQAGTIAGAEALTEACALDFQSRLGRAYEHAEGLYQASLRAGVPKELARLIVPVGRYSRMRASANLRNWLAFMTLRSAQGAQWEIRQYSWAMERLINRIFPRTYELFAERKAA